MLSDKTKKMIADRDTRVFTTIKRWRGSVTFSELERVTRLRGNILRGSLRRLRAGRKAKVTTEGIGRAMKYLIK